MGFFDDLFDFNGDGHMDDLEEALGMAMLFEVMDEEEEEDEDEEY